MPDFTFPATTQIFPEQDLILQYFERYVEDLKLKDTIQLSSQVIAVKQMADSTWELTLSNESKKNYDFLVLCNGTFHTPYVPPFPGTDTLKAKFFTVPTSSTQKRFVKGRR
jgi:cation diffusion facilitator CzcD-associated flavoprotein CzcO